MKEEARTVTVEEQVAARAAPAPPRAEPGPGAQMGRYVVLETLGRGGMGVVVAAYDSQLKRRVALKLMHSVPMGAGHTERENRERLLREAQAMARLTHPNVVAIHDVGIHDGQLFLAMELIDGLTLRTWLEQPHPWRETLEVLKAAGRGLQAAHASGLVHRDFKPANILIAHNGRVLVSDFGIAREDQPSPTSPGVHRPTEEAGDTPTFRGHPTPGAHEEASHSEPLTTPGALLGTLGYLAPEQARGEPVDARADQFAFCVTAYYALFGRKPFATDDLKSYLSAVLKGPPPPPQTSRVPRYIRQHLARGLHADPAQRFASMTALLAALDDDPWVRRRKLLAGVGAAALAAMGVGLYVRELREDAASSRPNPARLAGVWDGNVRQQALQAFVAANETSGAEAFERTARVLDLRADEWLSTDAQVRGAQRREGPSPLLDRKAACLERVRSDLKALVTLYVRADAAVVRAGPESAFSLTSPRWCADLDILRADVELPPEPERRQRVMSVREQLSAVRSLQAAGKFKEGLALMGPLVDEAAKIPHHGTLAEVHIAAGQLHESLGNYVAATTPYKEATWASARAGNDAMVARAAARVAFILGHRFVKLSEAEDWLGLAEASMDRIGENDDVHAEVLAVRGTSLLSNGRVEEGVALKRRVFELRLRTHGEEHLVTARASSSLGVALQLQGRPELALEQHRAALALYEKLLGPQSPNRAVELANVATCLIGLGRYGDAIAELERADAIGEQANAKSFWAAYRQAWLSLAWTLSGEPKKGLDAAHKGLSMAEAQANPERLTTPLLVYQGLALLDLGERERAFESCTKALEQQLKRPLRGDDPDAQVCLGRVHLERGRPGEAIAALQQSLARTQRMFPAELPAARGWLARALAANRDFEAARREGERARVELHGLGFEKEAQAVDAFLSELPRAAGEGRSPP